MTNFYCEACDLPFSEPYGRQDGEMGCPECLSSDYKELKTYKASFVRILHLVKIIEVLAIDKKDANKKFKEIFIENSMDIENHEMDGVHCEEFIQDIEEVE